MKIKRFTQKNFEDRTELRKFINTKFFYENYGMLIGCFHYTSSVGEDGEERHLGEVTGA